MICHTETTDITEKNWVASLKIFRKSYSKSVENMFERFLYGFLNDFEAVRPTFSVFSVISV